MRIGRTVILQNGSKKYPFELDFYSIWIVIVHRFWSRKGMKKRISLSKLNSIQFESWLKVHVDWEEREKMNCFVEFDFYSVQIAMEHWSRTRERKKDFFSRTSIRLGSNRAQTNFHRERRETRRIFLASWNDWLRIEAEHSFQLRREDEWIFRCDFNLTPFELLSNSEINREERREKKRKKESFHHIEHWFSSNWNWTAISTDKEWKEENCPFEFDLWSNGVFDWNQRGKRIFRSNKYSIQFDLRWNDRFNRERKRRIFSSIRRLFQFEIESNGGWSQSRKKRKWFFYSSSNWIWLQILTKQGFRSQ